jgi:hypothetical protein
LRRRLDARIQCDGIDLGGPLDYRTSFLCIESM